MVIAISFADEKFRNAQKLNTRTAYKYGADKVIEYSPKDIDEEFYKKNEHIFALKRGFGYWIWKPYVINKTLKNANYGDYVVYVDAGAAYVNKISYLIDIMKRDNLDVMCFCIDQMEREWDKRDILIYMDADNDQILDSNQICGGYIIAKKTTHSCALLNKYLELAQDERLITDMPNTMGVDNYPEFKEHRHDQSIWSLLCKKEGILPYRDPSQFGINPREYPIPNEVLKRSDYPQIVDSHRKWYIKYIFELEYSQKWYHLMLKGLQSRFRKIKNGLKK